MIGTKLAHYEITNHLGTGGMGEVYQATDAKLGRRVAIKLLPEAFSHDDERVARFEREAHVLASLNHPNIAAIHGIEESGGRKFLVMELVPGETLAEQIARGPLPVEEALHIRRKSYSSMALQIHTAGRALGLPCLIESINFCWLGI
jgi:serine/threonine protein kinase